MYGVYGVFWFFGGSNVCWVFFWCFLCFCLCFLVGVWSKAMFEGVTDGLLEVFNGFDSGFLCFLVFLGGSITSLRFFFSGSWMV